MLINAFPNPTISLCFDSILREKWLILKFLFPGAAFQFFFWKYLPYFDALQNFLY